MLTVDFQRLPVEPGDTVLDLGCGGGRHAFEVLRRGGVVTAFDQDADELAAVADMVAAMHDNGEVPVGGDGTTVVGDALDLPFDDGAFDRIIAAEVLEHIPDDTRAIAELARVLKPGGLGAITVPSWLPEKVCWALSDEYHEVEGGHVRIYGRRELDQKLDAAGFEVLGHGRAHALHSPYWWLKCAVGTDNDDHFAVRTYHQMLVWDIMKGPLVTRLADRVLNPVLGKSHVVYVRRRA